MKNTKMDLTQCPKSEYFTKTELISYIDSEINKLKIINPILENATLIKIESQSDSWAEYFMCRESFIDDALELLTDSYFCIWPRFLDNGKMIIYIAIKTGSKKQDHKFMKNFAMKYLWPLYCEPICNLICNVSEIIDLLLLFKKQVFQEEQETTKYKHDDFLIFNSLANTDDIQSTKNKLFNKLKKIEKFQNKYKEAI